MKPTKLSLFSIFSKPGCRRKLISALVIGLAFMVGCPSLAKAAGQCATPSACTFTIQVIQDNQIADGNQADLLKITVTDNLTGLPVTGLSINMKLAGASATTPGSTDATGVAIFPVTNTEAGPTFLTFLVYGYTINGATLTVNFIAGPPDPNPPGNPPGGTYFAVTQDNAIADGTALDSLFAHISDLYGNSVGAGVSVTFTITGGSASANATFQPANVKTTVTAVTDAFGDVRLGLTNITAGDVKIRATIGGVDINQSPQTAHFVHGNPDPDPPGNPVGGTNFWVVTDNATADGVSANVLKAHISDKYGNAVGAGVAVVFTVQGGAASGNAWFQPANVQTTVTLYTDANGDITFSMTDIKAGDVIVGASLAGVDIQGSPQTVHFVHGAPHPNPPGNPVGGTYFAVTQDYAKADGSSLDSLFVHISDKFGNAVGAGVPVTLTIIGGSAASDALFRPGGIATTITVMTDAEGNVRLGLTDLKVGDVLIKATLGGVDINQSPQTAHFVAADPDPNPPGNPAGGTYFIVTQDNAKANGSAQDILFAHISDSHGNAVGAGISITFTITGGSAAGTARFQPGDVATTITLTTDANGNITLPLTNTKVGDVIVQATLNGVAINGSSQTAHFIVGDPDPNPAGNPTGGTNFWVDKDNSVADGIDADVLKAHISDSHGNAVGAGVAVVFTITGGAAAGYAYFQPANVQTAITLYTDANGDISFSMTNIKAGGVIVSATLGGVNIHNSPQTAHFVAGPAVPSAPGAVVGPGTMLTVTTDYMGADGKKTDTVQAFITDKNGNPVAGVPVTFTITPGGTATAGALFQPAKATTVTLITDASGRAKAPISSTMAGEVWVNASIVYGGVNTLIDGSYQIAHFTNIPDVNNDATRIIVVVYQALADGVSTTVVKAHIVDQNGDALPGWDVTFKVDSGDAQMTTMNPVTTDMNGDAIVELSSTKPGFALITAIVNGESIRFGSPARVKFAAINIYVPKVFTPNGDGTNDVLKPILVGISSFHYFNVYNRWGNLIFTTQDPGYGWDGRFKGVPQPVETYLWTAEGVDMNGKKIVAKGMVSLVK